LVQDLKGKTMAIRGRKPGLLEAADAITKAPAMPSYLPTSMRDEWNSIAKDLCERRVLASSGLGSLETYIRALWVAREAQKSIEEHGLIVKTEKGALKSNPAATSLSEAQLTIARLAAELGLTPAARSRSGMIAEPKADLHDALGL
jgi:P27 family predicted phage terminase small subunit